MRTKLLAAAVAALAMTLLAPSAFAEPNPTPPGELPPLALETPAPTASSPATAPSVTATPTPSPTPSAPALTPAQALYVQPGYHLVNGRYWYTSCEMYSSTTVRCRTSIYATTVLQQNGRWYTQNTWAFNNLTYLPSPRAAWDGNPLASTGSWTSADGRRWKSECDTAATGRGACRSYIWATTTSIASGRVTQKTDWTFNGIVKFETALTPRVSSIPAAAPRPAGVPYPSAPVPVYTPSNVQQGFRLDSRCLTGRAFCVSKSQRKMAWVVNGKVDVVLDVRFGSELTPTRNGAWQVNWKSRNHVSSLYGSAMPFAMFFSGGQAIHYSSDFAARGYNGSSKGCVNVRDYRALERLFNLARVGDKVIVYN